MCLPLINIILFDAQTEKGNKYLTEEYLRVIFDYLRDYQLLKEDSGSQR
jgi:hypothetical protein